MDGIDTAQPLERKLKLSGVEITNSCTKYTYWLQPFPDETRKSNTEMTWDLPESARTVYPGQNAVDGTLPPHVTAPDLMNNSIISSEFNPRRNYHNYLLILISIIMLQSVTSPPCNRNTHQMTIWVAMQTQQE